MIQSLISHRMRRGSRGRVDRNGKGDGADERMVRKMGVGSEAKEEGGDKMNNK